MKGRTPTKEEKRHMDEVAQYGCYCCKKMGLYNDHILLHHTDGRTKPGAHFKVIPLCSGHHDYHQPEGFHRSPGAWRKIWGREGDILLELQEWLNE